jgi:Spy/CpxP family protein refolding chaperone
MTRGYDLDNAQREQMQVVLQQFVPAVMAQRRRLSDARQQMLTELGAGVVDKEQVKAHAANLNAAQAELDSLVTESLLREVEVLTPEQRAGYVERLAKGHRRPRETR